MIGVEMRSAEVAKELADRMLFERHILLNRTSETVLRFLPPLSHHQSARRRNHCCLGSLLQEVAAAEAVPVGEEVHG